MMPSNMNRRVVVAGVGYSQLGRSTGRSEGSLAAEAIKNALSDAGMRPADVDGLGTFPDRISGPFEGPSIAYVQQAFGLSRLRWFAAINNGAAQLSPVADGAYAIASGGADVVVCYRAHLRQTSRYYAPSAMSGNVASYTAAFRSPYGAPAGAAAFALWAMRYLHDSGYREEDLGSVVINNRTHAQRNPRAAWFGKPVTMEQYLKSDMIASPLRILDCDYPIDGAVAIVLAKADRAADLPHDPVYIEALAHSAGPSLDWDTWPDMSVMASRYVAADLWARTDLRPDDVDVAELYDGFSWFPLCWIEDLGLVERGGAGAFFRNGDGLPGGRLPVCTDGGQLGEGRLHGMGKLAEACLQVRGEAGERQVPGVEVAVACAGGGVSAAAALLTR
jgi:acetyl-CoA acetyltransferase